LGVGWLDAGLFSRLGWLGAGLFWALGWLGAGLFWALGWFDAGGFTTGGRFSSALPPPLAKQAEHSQAISKVGKLTARRLTWRDITYGSALPIVNGATFEPAAIDQPESSPLICSPAIVLNPLGSDGDEDREQMERLAADVVSHLR
jgi:hypothetical protein